MLRPQPQRLATVGPVSAPGWLRKAICPSRSAAHTNQRDETVLRGDVFSEVLHNMRVRHSRRHCLLHFSIGLPIRGKKNRNATLQSQNPLVSPETARAGHRFLTPHLSRWKSECRDYCRRPSHSRIREEQRTKTLPPDRYSVSPTVDHDDSR